MARFNEHQKDMAYRIYLTDSLQIIGQNTARYAGGNSLKMRYRDIVEPKPEETRTAEDIIKSITSKLGGEQY